MFREDLHRSFDNISPSAELLDRISAMMSEEAAKKKPPIRMQIVKYGGIAAALVLAAGGTLAVMQMNNGGIKTSETNSAAPMYAETAAAAAGDMYSDGAAAENAASEAETYKVATEATAKVLDIADDTPSFVAAESIETSQAAVQTQSEETKAANVQPISPEAEQLDEVAAEEAVEEADCADAEDSFSNADSLSGVDNFMGITSIDANNEASGISSADADKSDDDAGNAATGVYETDAFLNAFEPSFTMIPDALKDLGDGSYGEAWTRYMYEIKGLSVPKNDEDDEDAIPADMDRKTPVNAASVDNDINIYTFIKYFNIPEDKARAALEAGGALTSEQINTVLTADTEAVTAQFATGEAIVKGDKVYTPLWLLSNSYEDYSAAGITKDDIRAKYDLLTTMTDRYSDAVIDAETQKKLTDKLDGFLK